MQNFLLRNDFENIIYVLAAILSWSQSIEYIGR